MFEPSYCPRCAGALASQLVDDRPRPVCAVCGFVYYLDPKVAVAVIVPYQAGIILGRRAIDPGLGLWSFPSGYVDRGEVVEQAAVREVYEEIGARVEIEGLVGVYSEAGQPVVLVVYAAEVVDGIPAPGPEMSELGVFSPDELPAMAFSHDRRIIEDWRRLTARAVSSAL